MSGIKLPILDALYLQVWMYNEFSPLAPYYKSNDFVLYDSSFYNFLLAQPAWNIWQNSRVPKRFSKWSTLQDSFQVWPWWILSLLLE